MIGAPRKGSEGGDRKLAVLGAADAGSDAGPRAPEDDE